jgi:hypothetical protein
LFISKKKKKQKKKKPGVLAHMYNSSTLKRPKQYNYEFKVKVSKKARSHLKRA